MLEVPRDAVAADCQGEKKHLKEHCKGDTPARECRAEGDKKPPYWMQVVTTHACLPACSKPPLDDSGRLTRRQHQERSHWTMWLRE